MSAFAKKRFLKKENNPMFGKTHNIETKIKISKKQKSKYGMDKNHINWNNFTTPLVVAIRKSYDSIQWRNSILKRDNYICQKCGRSDRTLQVHHHIKAFHEIIYENNITDAREAKRCTELWDINNGITLCTECHRHEHSLKK